MSEKQFNTGRHNEQAPQKGMAAVDTDSTDEREQDDKKQTPGNEQREQAYDNRPQGNAPKDEETSSA